MEMRRSSLPPVTGQFRYRPATNSDGASPQPGWDLVWVSPRSGQYSGREHIAKILDCWYPASYMRAVREHLGRMQPLNELSEPAATNLLGAHVEFTSRDEAYTDLTPAFIAFQQRGVAQDERNVALSRYPRLSLCSGRPSNSSTGYLTIQESVLY
jgi:hypothetical protein